MIHHNFYILCKLYANLENFCLCAGLLQQTETKAHLAQLFHCNCPDESLKYCEHTGRIFCCCFCSCALINRSVVLLLSRVFKWQWLVEKDKKSALSPPEEAQLREKYTQVYSTYLSDMPGISFNIVVTYFYPHRTSSFLPQRQQTKGWVGVMIWSRFPSSATCQLFRRASCCRTT